VALRQGIKEDCHRIEYDPQGDRVPIARKQTFVFDEYVSLCSMPLLAPSEGFTSDVVFRVKLVALLDQLPRPHAKDGGVGAAESRGAVAGSLLTVPES